MDIRTEVSICIKKGDYSSLGYSFTLIKGDLGEPVFLVYSHLMNTYMNR